MKFHSFKDYFSPETDKRIESELKTLMSRIEKIAETLETATVQMIEKDTTGLETSASNITALEKEVDNIRRKTEQDIYSKKSAIYNKAEKIELLESLDDIADAAQEAAELLTIKVIKVDENLHADLKGLASSTKKSIKALSHAVDSLFTDLTEVKRYDALSESERNNARSYHTRIMRKLFASCMDIKDIMILKSVSERITKTADAAESSSDRLNYMAMKYAE